MSQTKEYSRGITSRNAPVMTTPWYRFAHRFDGLWIDGQLATYPVVNERAVRATAGLTFVAAGTAFFLAFFLGNYTPLKVVTLLAFTDFALRLVTGMTPLSPLGLLGTWLVHKQRPEWVGAAQKRFAWTLGLIMSGTVALLVNTGRTGTLSASLCMICLTLMWMETALGLCIGCSLYRWLARSRVIRQPDVQPACPGGMCAVPRARPNDRTQASEATAGQFALDRVVVESRARGQGEDLSDSSSVEGGTTKSIPGRSGWRSHSSSLRERRLRRPSVQRVKEPAARRAW